MNITTSITTTIVIYLLLNVFDTDAVIKKIIEEVNICKRNDPQIQNCYCENFSRLIPVVKDGIPEMNIIPIDPVQMEQIKLDWPQPRAIEFRAELNNITMHGLSLGRLVLCNAYMTEDGIQLALDLTFPKLEMKSTYSGHAKYMLLAFHGSGDFWGKYDKMYIKSIWNSTRFMKHGKEHLKFTAKITHLTMEKIQIHFSDILGNTFNSTEISDKINEMLNENIDVLYDEIQPIVLQAVEKLSSKIVNDLYYTFPFDVLYPKN